MDLETLKRLLPWKRGGSHPDSDEKKPLTLKEIGLPKLVVMLLCGMVLLGFTFSDFFSNQDDNSNLGGGVTQQSEKQSENLTESDEYTDAMENKLKQALSTVKGIGKVEVMITTKSSKELVPLKDNVHSEDSTKEEDSTGGSRENTSTDNQEETVNKSVDGDTTPFIVKEMKPEVEGVLVIAEGGDHSSTVSEIVDAVMVLFDVPSHKIKVMKMNS